VPYHVVYMKEKLTAAFRQGNADSILFYAADIGHYISDANVPLHTTMNYDGQLTNQKGLHSLWETMIPEIQIEQYNLYGNHRAIYLKHPEQNIWRAVRNAAALVPDMLAKEKEISANFTTAQKFRTQIRKGKSYQSYTSEFAIAYAASLKNTINQQLLASANLIADFYYTAWVDAGKPSLENLDSVYDAEKSNLKEDLKSFKHNTLIKTEALLSKKVSEKE
jgi:hypothetical protein